MHRKKSAAKDNKMSMNNVFIDLGITFDTINFNILIKKLDHYPIRGIVVNRLHVSIAVQAITCKQITCKHHDTDNIQS